MAKIVKKRNWAIVVYPESAPENWIEILQKKGLVCAISPLHDKDINPDGESKKPHWHVIICYEGPTSYNVVKSITDELNAPAPTALEHVKGYYRYLTHKDNPEKAQYKESEIISINGFNIANFTELTRAEVFELKKRIQTFIVENDILEYADLLDSLLESEMYSELEVAQNNTLLFNTYITSRRNRKKAKQKEQFEKDLQDLAKQIKSENEVKDDVEDITGEVLDEV